MSATNVGNLLSRERIGPCLPQFKEINRYHDPVNHCVSAKLLPGEYYVTMVDEMVTTILGSCIAACIYDAERGYGGMNHFLLPGSEQSAGAKSKEESTRYGIYAMESMINDVLKCGSRRENLRAKIFGGGKIIAGMTDVGHRNICFVKEYLSTEGISVESSDIGLTYPRKVNFFPKRGKAMVKRLQSLHNHTIEKREKEYIRHLAVSEVKGEVELF